MIDPFEGEDFSFLDEEAAKVKDWPEGMQELVDKGVVKVEYDENGDEQFSLTELGRALERARNPNLN